MKKSKIIVVAGAILVSLSALANVTVNFNSAASTIMLADGITRAPASITFAVYSSADGTADFSSSSTLTSPGGNDTYLGDFTTGTSSGRITGNNVDNFASLTAGGNIYIVVFNAAWNAGAPTIGAGTQYGVGFVYGPTANQDIVPQPAPDSYGTHYTAVAPLLLNQTLTLVPEPTTLAFFGIGGLLFAIRRFRRS